MGVLHVHQYVRHAFDQKSITYTYEFLKSVVRALTPNIESPLFTSLNLFLRVNLQPSVTENFQKDTHLL